MTLTQALTRRKFLGRGLVAAPMLAGLLPWQQIAAVAENATDVIPPIRWSQEIKVSYYTQGLANLVTAHAPSLASENSTIYLAHVGDAGSTLWLKSFAASDALNKLGSNGFAEQVMPYGKAAKVSGAPACVRYAGYTAILATDEDKHGVTCYLSDGTSWSSIPVFSGADTFSSPKAVVAGDRIEVFATADGRPHHAFCQGRIFDRSSWKITAPTNPALVDSLAASGSRVVAVCQSNPQIQSRYQGTYALNAPTATLQPPFQRLVLSGNSPAMNSDGAVVFMHQGNTGYVYRAADSNQLFYAYAESGSSAGANTVTLQPSVTLQGKSSELPGVTVVGDVIYLAYKGQSTHDMYMLRGSF